jgi:large subunit ribosomal protein L33
LEVRRHVGADGRARRGCQAGPPGRPYSFRSGAAPPQGGARVQRWVMAKSNVVQIRLVSSADTGYFYVTKKNAKNKTAKMELRKYDPVARKHVVFREAKIK